MSIGGAVQQVTHTGPRYSALYEIEGPHVLVSAAWAQAVDWAAGPARSGPTPAIGSTRSIRSASGQRPCNQLRALLMIEARCTRHVCR